MRNLKDTISTHQNNYNLIRLVLASSVIFYHSFLLSGSKGYADGVDAFFVSHGASLGQVAVGGFFLLSGIFVSQSFSKDGNPVNFAIKRFCRIWPGLFVCLCLTALIACILSQKMAAPHYIFSLDFLQYIVQNSKFSITWGIPGIFEGRPDTAINGSIHTLPTEVKLYAVLLGFGLLLSFKKPKRLLFVAGLMMVVSLFLYTLLARCLYLAPDAQMFAIMFFAGVLLLVFAEHVKPYLWIGAVGAAMMLLAPAPFDKIGVFATTAWCAVFIGQAKHCRSPRTDLSYGIYIYGWPCQQFVAIFLPGLDPYTHALLSVLLASGFAFASWHLIEKPAMDFGRNLIAKIANSPSWQNADGFFARTFKTGRAITTIEPAEPEAYEAPRSNE